MSPELEQKFFDRFSFFHPEKSPQETLMCFGFECSDGWFELLWSLCEDIDKMDKPEDFEVVQVKEKFGSLRFYTNNTTDEIYQRIKEADKQSEKICEVCGKEGKMRADMSWITTLCDENYNNQNQKLDEENE